MLGSVIQSFHNVFLIVKFTRYILMEIDVE